MTAERIQAWERSRVAEVIDVSTASPIRIIEERQTIPNVDRVWQAATAVEPSARKPRYIDARRIPVCDAPSKVRRKALFHGVEIPEELSL